jgi:two-component system, OmpR family, sensor kinase
MTRPPRLFVPWVVLASVCSALMWLSPGDETIPYHIAWIGVALAYGFDPWPAGRTFTAIGLYTLVTGGILAVRAGTGAIAWEETAEIPLMAILVMLSVWHVRRRQSAIAQLRRVAISERMHAAQRERLSRLTSHEMRTPLTIAMGYLDLLLDGEPEGDRRADLLVVRDELGRLSRAGERLLRMIRLHDELRRERVDLGMLFEQVADRWSTVAERHWVVQSEAGTCFLSSERLRACLDTLIENALRYTTAGDVIRLTSFRTAGAVHVGVADSGPGFGDELAMAINNQDFRTAQQLTETSVGGQTGLGLGLLHEMVAASDGKVLAGRSAEGGALVLMALLDRVEDSVRGEEVGHSLPGPDGHLQDRSGARRRLQDGAQTGQ